MHEVKVTNLVKVYTILLLRKRPMHGYEILKSLGSILLKDISASHVYPFLKTLEKNRFVTSRAAGSRDKKEYKLTATGQDFAQDLIDKFAELVDISVSGKITACAHCGCRIASGGYKKKVDEKATVFCCIRCAESYVKGDFSEKE